MKRFVGTFRRAQTLKLGGVYIQSTVDSFSYFMVWREQKNIYIRRDAGCFRGHKSWVPCYCTNQRGLNGKAIKFGSS